MLHRLRERVTRWLIADEAESRYWSAWDAIEDHRQVCHCPTKVEIPEFTCQPHAGIEDTPKCVPHLHGVLYVRVHDDGTTTTEVR